MTKKIIWIMLCSILIAGCAKLVDPGSTPIPIGSAANPIGAPTLASPTIETPSMSLDSPLPMPDFESPLATPFESPLLTPDMTSPIATPKPK